MRCKIVSLQWQTDSRGKMICGLFEKTHGLGFWLKCRKGIGNKVQDNMKISPYKICFYAQLQGTPTVSSADLDSRPLQKYQVVVFTQASHRLQDICWFGKQRLTFRGWIAFQRWLKFCFFEWYNASPEQLYARAIVCILGWAGPWAFHVTEG